MLRQHFETVFRDVKNTDMNANQHTTQPMIQTTQKLHGAVSVAEQVINPFSLSYITNVGRLDNTEYIFFFFLPS